MSRVSDHTLRALLIDALEPGEAARLAEQLAGSAALRRRLRALRAELEEAELEEAEEEELDRWVLPPPGLGLGGLRAQATPGLYLGEPEAPRTVDLLLRAPDALPRLVVLLLAGARGWEIALPRSPDEILPFDALDPGSAGERILRLQPPPGTRRACVALPPLSWAEDLALPEPARWARLRAGILSGEVPTLTLDLPDPGPLPAR